MNSLQGYLLVSSPQLLDPNFFKTVVLLVQHDENGALGLVLNRPAETTIKEAWEQVSESACERADALHIGGPCQGVLMAVHTDKTASQIEVVPGLHFTTDAENMAYLVRQEELPLKFFVGYAGWAAGQLEGELETGSWLTTPATFEYVFRGDENLWTQVTRQIAQAKALAGIDPKLIPPDPSMN